MNEVTSVGHSTVLHYLSREMCKPHDSVLLSFVAVILWHIFHFSTDVALTLLIWLMLSIHPQMSEFSLYWENRIPMMSLCDDWYNTTAKHDHYSDAIMSVMASQITSLTMIYSNVYSGSDQRKYQSSAFLAFVWEFTGDRWIPRTKGQWRGKCFHLMTSSWSCAVRVHGLGCTACFIRQHQDRLLIKSFTILLWSVSCNILI